MATQAQDKSARTVLLAAARNTPVASRMAMRFAGMGCRVAAVYPSKAHLLASTKAVSSHFHYGSIDPVGTLLNAMSESGAEVVAPCDGITVRHLHALYGNLPSTPEGGAFAQVIQRSLGDPTAYLVVDSRHEIQMSARNEELNAAESFAIGKATDPEKTALALPFPWMLKTDYSWGPRGQRMVRTLGEARRFIRKANNSPSLAMVARQMLVNDDRAALEEWLHAKRPGLSAQRPIAGLGANAVAACWKGTVLASISVEGLPGASGSWPQAIVRMVENPEMDRSVRRMSDRLGLTGFHSFDFVLEAGTGKAWLTEFNSHCTQASHLNAGAGHDLVAAFCERWLGTTAGESAAAPGLAQAVPVHPGKVLAYFPQALAANPSDPILDTGAFDIPSEDPEFVRRAKELAARDERYEKFKSRVSSLFSSKR